jgi:RNA polymerase sigma-70 factor (ECF subfamily)
MSEIPPTRASLLLRLRDPRDAGAWKEFVELYAPLVFGYARKQGLQDADAADLCQDVLGSVARSVGKLEYDASRGAFRNWLFTLVRRRLADWRDAQERRLPASGDTATHQLLEQCLATQNGEAAWESQWRRQVFIWACEQARHEVSENTWQAFWRTAVDGQSGKQVAAELKLTVAAVYHSRSRVLARLKELVQSRLEC